MISLARKLHGWVSKSTLCIHAQMVCPSCPFTRRALCRELAALDAGLAVDCCLGDVHGPSQPFSLHSWSHANKQRCYCNVNGHAPFSKSNFYFECAILPSGQSCPAFWASILLVNSESVFLTPEKKKGMQNADQVSLWCWNVECKNAAV